MISLREYRGEATEAGVRNMVYRLGLEDSALLQIIEELYRQGEEISNFYCKFKEKSIDSFVKIVIKNYEDTPPLSGFRVYNW